ncbi:MAG: GDP-mannose 4,6-dehydratase [Chitinophagaceae bacterium]|jgi:GDPmannose 4,6-dehydratase
MKKALITGITGQDGSYLAELLLLKGYEVHGIKRRSSSFNTQRLDHIYRDSHEDTKLKLHYGDLADSSNLIDLVGQIGPDEIYNLGAQSHVGVSFSNPEMTSNVNALGVLRMLEAIRITGLATKTRFYQASSSELYGLVQESPQNEGTPFYPRSPYGVSKLFGYWITRNYREAYGFYASNGILFNHESPRRGETFVTRKVTRGLSRIIFGLEKCLYMGNLNAQRDWGHAQDFVRAQWLILQRAQPADYVIATNTQFSIRDLIRLACKHLGIDIVFSGSGEHEVGIINSVSTPVHTLLKKDDVIVRVDPRYFRPSEVETLLGDASKARRELDWQPTITLDDLIAEMCSSDLKAAQKDKFLKDHGFTFDERASE